MAVVFDHNNNKFNQGITYTSPATTGPISVTQDGVVWDSFSSALGLQGGAYTLTVAGTLVSTVSYGAVFQAVALPNIVQKVTVSATGSISGSSAGILALNGLTLTNAGLIEGLGGVLGGNTLDKFTITNSGIIRGGAFGHAINLQGAGVHTITNSGRLEGAVSLGNGIDTVTNSGAILNHVNFHDGNDVLTNSKYIAGGAYMGRGNDKLTNSGKMNSVADLSDGNDVLINSGTIHGAVSAGSDNDTVTNSTKGIMNSSVSLGSGQDKFTNVGTVNGAFNADGDNDVVTNSGKMLDVVMLGEGHDRLTNTGTMGDGVDAGGGNDVVTNSGTIAAYVVMGEGNDTLTNTGTIDGAIMMGAGDDKFTGGAKAEEIYDDSGSDLYLMGGGDDQYFATNAGAATGNDTVDGGLNAALDFDAEMLGDTYYLTGNSDLIINLDTVAHSFGSLTVVAGKASSLGAGTDFVKNLESVYSGNGHDVIFGTSGANYLRAEDGNDLVLGYGGNDKIMGGLGIDSLAGGIGRDTLDAGEDASADYFVYFSAAESTTGAAGRDQISNFRDAHDYFDFRPMTQAGLMTNGHWQGMNTGFDGTQGAVRAMTVISGWLVQVDLNGDKKADMAIEVLDPTHLLVGGWGSEDFLFG